jgi:hypothetical protein
MNYPVLNTENEVVNVIVCDEDFNPGKGLKLGKPGGNVGDTWNGNEYVKSSEPEVEITSMDIENERFNRLSVGIKHKFGSKEHVIGSRKWDMEGWKEVNEFASTLKATDKFTIETNTGSVDVTKTQWTKMYKKLLEFRQHIFLKSFELLKMDSLPQDYTDEKYWK